MLPGSVCGYGLLRTGFYALLTALAPFRMVYTGMFVKYDLYFADYAIGACLNACPAGLTQPGAQPDIFSGMAFQ
jgi:hypothetical protein